MAQILQFGHAQTRRKSAPQLSRPIEPELKNFIDEYLVPMLVRDALKAIATNDKKSLAQMRSAVPHSAPSAVRRAEEMA
jgi:hypothetical protein